jgi:hypothetical protein
VQTPYLAAVVKGTKFVVTSDADGARVDVKRGHVAVHDSDTHESTLVAAGQSAETGSGTPLEVSGSGEMPDIVDARGRVVATAATSGGSQATESEGRAAGRFEESNGRANSANSASSAGESDGKSAESNGNSSESNGKSGESNGRSDESNGRSGESHGKSDDAHGRGKKDD